MFTKEEKEDEMYGENAVGGTIENLDMESFKSLNDFPRTTPQNPLAEMMKGLTSMLTANRPQSQKLTLSGMVGDSHINMEITDSFTASMAHDIINRVTSDLKLKREVDENKAEKTVRGTSEEDMFRQLSSKKNQKLTD